jgi:hypothetical protein
MGEEQVADYRLLPAELTSQYAGCLKKGFASLKAYVNFFRRQVHILNCHNIAKETSFYLG